MWRAYHRFPPFLPSWISHWGPSFSGRLGASQWNLEIRWSLRRCRSCSCIYLTRNWFIPELGHGAGHEAVDFVVETLPGMIKGFLASAFGATNAIWKPTIEEILVQCISGIDDRIKADLVNFFPGGPEQIAKLTDDEIRSTIRDPETGNSYVQIMRARTGTTALIALIDPLKSLHVASLGDCEAGEHVEYINWHFWLTSQSVLGIQNALGGWEVKILSGHHNASNEVEADRVRAAHPDEAECIHQYRTLGLITLTRGEPQNSLLFYFIYRCNIHWDAIYLAIGDSLFKLPPIYTERVLALATPPFHENYKVTELLARNLTPPYLSNRAEVEHVDLASLDPSASPVLVLCSDGLIDLYSRRSKIKDIAQAVQLWITTLTHEGRDNLALDLLWDALGGDDGAEVSSKIVRGTSNKRVDDTTVVVLQLWEIVMISLLFHTPYKSLHIVIEWCMCLQQLLCSLSRIACWWHSWLNLDNDFTPGHWNPSNQLACVCKSGYRLEAICVVSRAHVQHTYYTSPYI